nr:hypothetical protein Q903MT_gene3360 [Picea sitchensis]
MRVKLRAMQLSFMDTQLNMLNNGWTWNGICS